MAILSSLNYPNKSHRKAVALPKYSVQLAEFLGIMMGDGGINNPWQATITLNAIKDKEYAAYISNLCDSLFDTTPAIRKRKYRQALVLCLSSTTIVDFLVEQGLIRGNKLKGGLAMPTWILSKRSYRIACVRGLMDTDGCLFVHTHVIAGKKYRNLGLCFCTYSPELMNQVVGIFTENGIITHINYPKNSLYIYKAADVMKYLQIFGSSNARIYSVVEQWRDARAV